ncbi:MAG TPA: outer membrane beta-barrel protein [Bacteroidota bacterium]|jgi:hypothetical protein|nr:outer membrane beta-barrel protein [Bacteroidota bacterium]
MKPLLIGYAHALLFVVTVAISSVSLQAQSDQESFRTYGKIVGGFSIPTGEFSSTTTAQSGFAKLGLGLAGELNFEVLKGFELGLMTDFSLNELDHDELQRQYQKELSGSNVTAGFWYLVGIMGSGGFGVEASPAVRLYGKIYTGVIIANLPEIKIATAGVSARQSSASAAAFGFGFGGGMIIKDRVDLGVRYLTAEAEYEVTFTVTDNYDGRTSSQKGKFKQPSGTIQILLGYVIF